ncbi:SDR family oxidoreductase [Pseudomaricurvus alkylphenolicus]|jgi:NAD(P)-dependent dehydrogenase (short-subunit alcohol dehydrogenase family)|uniref:SDR family oxidoreductase n=1 Tax=Pseudomaricurvus alkylphenolicus TaxID=1306991 RepID=UPI001422614D|nr:SDR family oxidoreductase [Pseudomaricurvus alkylphenolicus]NIB41236.1 SDR family oxidoreductase [Pseudomaricurvus alkylphenolicus]
MSKTVVITGANRGIGLSFARYYSDLGWTVYAGCRQSSSELNGLMVNVIEGADVADPEGITQLVNALKGASVDVLINNAGVLHYDALGGIDADSIRRQFEVNALGPLMVCEALRDNLSSGGKIALITSRMGSIADNTSGSRYGYRMSKAALNMAGVSLAHDLSSQGVAVAILHPGLVGTDMIGGRGDITPDQAAERLAQRIDELNLDNSGTFWHSNGQELPW